MCMLILISHHLPDTHKLDVRVKILCVLNTPPRHNVVWGVKEYYLAVFIPTEKVKNSQLHAKAVYSQGKKSHCVLGGSQNRSGSSGRRKKNIFFLRRIKSGYSSHQSDVFPTVHHSTGYFYRTNFNAHFNMNMYVTLSSTLFLLKMGMSRPETCRG